MKKTRKIFLVSSSRLIHARVPWKKKYRKGMTGIFYSGFQRFSRSVVPQIKRINDQRHASWRQRLPAVPAVIALDLTFILRQSSTALNPFLTIIFVGSDKESYRQNEKARLNLKAVSSTLRNVYGLHLRLGTGNTFWSRTFIRQLLYAQSYILAKS